MAKHPIQQQHHLELRPQKQRSCFSKALTTLCSLWPSNKLGLQKQILLTASQTRTVNRSFTKTIKDIIKNLQQREKDSIIIIKNSQLLIKRNAVSTWTAHPEETIMCTETPLRKHLWGWRDDAEVKSAYCSCRRTCVQSPAQTPVTPAPGGLSPPSGPSRYCTHRCTVRFYWHIIKCNINKSLREHSLIRGQLQMGRNAFLIFHTLVLHTLALGPPVWGTN